MIVFGVGTGIFSLPKQELSYGEVPPEKRGTASSLRAFFSILDICDKSELCSAPDDSNSYHTISAIISENPEPFLLLNQSCSSTASNRPTCGLVPHKHYCYFPNLLRKKFEKKV